ncbi:MAG TPA: 50S ribosomal protein L25 [Candidatus Sphingobacterium stercoripullorum]|uniref:Large ribosomal subunit protein bL25 n=1 Tax=Candidatus Sphingobacterium stercoripullorum TaxID=2838759 RepID=A0A9D1W9L9_9SPHI|nr:50S ribosomal protein L25 [Candidatus Sphingobacterium stercoripullorum]
MKSIAISGSVRQNVGKRDTKELRYEGRVPAVLYGGSEQIHFSVSAADLTPVFYTADAQFIELDIDGDKRKAIVQDSQFHPLTEQVQHIDFLELSDDKEVTMTIPIVLTGTSAGVRMGGRLAQKLRTLRVKALPGNMPQTIEVPINSLEIGSSYRVEKIEIENAKILNNSDDTIVSVLASRASKQAATEEEEAK